MANEHMQIGKVNETGGAPPVTVIQSDESKPKRQSRRLTEADMDNVTSNTAFELARQSKVRIRLRQNPKGQPQLPDPMTAQLNGHTFMIVRGKDVEVPQAIFDILREAGEI